MVINASFPLQQNVSNFQSKLIEPYWPFELRAALPSLLKHVEVGGLLGHHTQR